MKKLYVYVLSVIAVLAANAEPVSRSEALQKARQFMPGKQFNANQASSRSKRVMADKEPFYIFNAEEGGFVVISGDDRTVPVIGYSEKGQLLQDDMPDNLRNWLEGYAEQLQAIENGEATPALPRSTRVTRGVSAKPAIGPLIQTQWNQSAPYNLMTPTYTYTYNNVEYTEHYVTGCVATALAQVMNYYQWPETCPAIDAYTTRTRGISMPALPETTFDWSLMKNKYASNETGDEAYAVAKLMLYVGQACSMDYDYDGSAASISQSVMINTFGYSRNMHTVSRSNYTTVEWENLIYQELEAGRPVLYDGASTSSGHQFICDGYDGNGLFHMNWGWGGQSDSYFVLSIANPYSKGIGGGTSKSGYIFRQAAIIGFQPSSGNEPEIPRIYSNVSSFSNATYTRTSIDEDFTDVSTANCKFYGTYSYVPTTTYPIEVAWALWQNDEVLSVLETPSKNYTIDNTQIPAGYYYTPSSPTPVSFGAGLADGDYRLVQVWRPQGGEGDWTVMSSMNSLRVNIAGNDLTIRKPNTSNVTCTVNTVDTGGKLVKGEPTSITVNLTNTSDASQETLYFWVNYGSSWELCGKGIGFVESGETGDVEILYTPSSPGDYSAKITTDSEGNNGVWSSTITIYDLVEAVVDNITYRYVEGNDYADIVTAEASAFAGKPLVIHSTVTIDDNTYNIRKIESKAFQQVNMTSLTIEEGVESIETQAFIYCFNLEEVSLPTTLKNIGTYAFFNCSNLTVLTIPEGEESIGSYAFNACYSLAKVTLPSTLQTIGENAFGKIKLGSLISNMQHPCAINANVFDQVDLTGATLYVPEGAKSEYEAAAVWQDFGSILQGEVKETTIAGITYRYVTGEGVADIIASDAEVLKNQELVIGNVTIDEKTYSIRKIESNVFRSVNISKLTIEPGVESIESQAFMYCYSLTEVTLPNTLKNIGTYAFFNDYCIEKIVIPEGVESIGAHAFRACQWLSELSLPSTLTSIGEQAFGGSTIQHLSKVVCSIRNPFDINPNVFQNKETFTTAKLTIPAGSKANYQAATGWQNFFSSDDNIVEIEAGDSNRDGTISVTDIAYIVNAILSLSNGGDFFMAGADANGDGGITVTDIGVIVDMILGTGGTNNARRMSRGAVEPQ